MPAAPRPALKRAAVAPARTTSADEIVVTGSAYRDNVAGVQSRASGAANFMLDFSVRGL